MGLLSINRYRQQAGECAIAASASLSNLFCKDIDYKYARKVCHEKVTTDTVDGLHSGSIGLLLNNLGFEKVTIVSSDADIYDYSWQSWTSKKIASALKKKLSHDKVEIERKDEVKEIVNFLDNSGFNNNLLIDFRFGSYIRKSLDKGVPILVSFNWTVFFKIPKQDVQHHLVLARGYDDKGIHVVDSQTVNVMSKKYSKGFYRIPWEEFFTVLGVGDLFIVDKFNPELSK